MYQGMALVIFSAIVYSGALSAVLVLPLFVGVINQIQIQPEEHALEAIFGDEYLHFKKRVRRWI